MRVFTPFAWLALMHTARGGELDQFSSDRARATRDYIELKRNRSKDTVDSSHPPGLLTRSAELLKSFMIADANDDGRISYDELVSQILFTWKSEERLERALRTFELPTIRDFMTTHDFNGDGYLDAIELQHLDSLYPRDIRAYDTGHCPTLVSKIESCPTHLVIGCAEYFQVAEGLCYSGHRNHVETCITTESCDNMCKCIGNVEAAMTGNALMVVQNPDGTSIIYDPNHLQKRFWFLLFFLLTILTSVVSDALATVMLDVAESERAQFARWMDFKFWDGTSDPPSCSIYIFYGHCGAILSSTARNCPDGGSRIYGNSCKDHFRYGSRGCSFLSMGCQSLCYNINERACPCSTFTWKELDDINLPGNDIRSFHVDQTSDCRSACNADANCIAFTILPPTGDVNQVNCFLKQQPLPVISVERYVTSFLKLGGDLVCTTTLTESGPYDEDWNPSSTLMKRDLLDYPIQGGELLDKAGSGPARAFPPVAEAALIAGFLRLLYEGAQRLLTQEATTATYLDRIAAQIGANTMAGTAQGQIDLTDSAAPRWAGNEITYRILTVVRGMLRASSNQPANPITEYLSNTVNDDPLAQALFPPDVRDLLTDNQNLIQNAAQPSLPWNGRSRDVGAIDYADPFPGIQVGYDRRNTYFQRGNAGPFGLEAAFLLAAQVAGVNWNHVYQIGIAVPQLPTWFTGVIQPTTGRASGRCMMDRGIRRIGYSQRVPGSTTHAPRAGVYVALDLDPDLAVDDPNHNVFLFVVHTSDRSSIIHVPNVNNLLNMAVTRYVPENNGGTALFHLPSGSTTRIEPGQPGNPIPSPLLTRAFAHAHATMMNYQTFTSWLSQGSSTGTDSSPSTFPPYTPFGFIHIYILGEDFNAMFPRLDYLERP